MRRPTPKLPGNTIETRALPAPDLKSTMTQNARSGAARQSYVQGKLEGRFGQGNVQAEQYLRSADGSIAKDPLTGTGRRIDYVVSVRKQLLAVKTGF
jgi:hypothetical protein